MTNTADSFRYGYVNSLFWTNVIPIALFVSPIVACDVFNFDLVPFVEGEAAEITTGTLAGLVFALGFTVWNERGMYNNSAPWNDGDSR